MKTMGMYGLVWEISDTRSPEAANIGVPVSGQVHETMGRSQRVGTAYHCKC